MASQAAQRSQAVLLSCSLVALRGDSGWRRPLVCVLWAAPADLVRYGRQTRRSAPLRFPHQEPRRRRARSRVETGPVQRPQNTVLHRIGYRRPGGIKASPSPTSSQYGDSAPQLHNHQPPQRSRPPNQPPSAAGTRGIPQYAHRRYKHPLWTDPKRDAGQRAAPERPAFVGHPHGRKVRREHQQVGSDRDHRPRANRKSGRSPTVPPRDTLPVSTTSRARTETQSSSTATRTERLPAATPNPDARRTTGRTPS